MSDCGCSAPSPAEDSAGFDLVGPLPPLFLPTSLPPMPYAKGWDGVLRSADEVMAQLFGRPWPEKRAARELRWATHPKASGPRKRWARLAPAPIGVAGWSPEKDREENPEAWIPVVPRLRRAGSSGTLAVGPLLGATALGAPGPLEAPSSRFPGQIPSALTPPGSIPLLPAFDTCDGWSTSEHAAPLLDPGVHEHLTDCQTDPDTRFRLWVTSVCTVQLHNGGTRLYFFDGKFKDDLPPDDTGDHFPPYVTRTGSSGGNVFKFAPYRATASELNEFWRHEYSTSPPTPVTSLHFCRDLIGFMDSEDGFEFPLYTPIVSNVGAGCDFAKARVFYRWRWDEDGVPQSQARPTASQDGRAGWRSTVIPCRGASVVYQSHAVLRLDLDGDVVYLMLAGRCDGRGRGPGRVGQPGDSVASDCCDICAPPGDIPGPGCGHIGAPCLGENPIPTTDLVLFLCPNANFQAGTLGPYGLLRQAPDWSLGQWVGVPTAFESPDERFVFLYVHPQPPQPPSKAEPAENPAGLYGMFAARKDDLRAAIREILSGSSVDLIPANGVQLHPGRSEAEVDAALEAGRAILAPVFFPLGPIQVCGRGGSSPEEIQQVDWVDEHFLFHNDRLRMYATHVSAPSGGASQPVLDRILRYGVEAGYDAEALDAILDGRLFAFAFEEGPIERMQASLLRFQQAACDAVVADELDRWATLTTPTMEVNDPATETYTLADGATATRLLFHSANAGGLMVRWTRTALGGERECP